MRTMIIALVGLGLMVRAVGAQTGWVAFGNTVLSGVTESALPAYSLSYDSYHQELTIESLLDNPTETIAGVWFDMPDACMSVVGGSGQAPTVAYGTPTAPSGNGSLLWELTFPFNTFGGNEKMIFQVEFPPGFTAWGAGPFGVEAEIYGNHGVAVVGGVTAAIPEPGSILFAGLGLLAFAGLRRHR